MALGREPQLPLQGKKVIALKEWVRAFRMDLKQSKWISPPLTQLGAFWSFSRRVHQALCYHKGRDQHSCRSREAAGSNKCQHAALPHHLEILLTKGILQATAQRHEIKRAAARRQAAGRQSSKPRRAAPRHCNNRQRFINLAQKALGDFKKC